MASTAPGPSVKSVRQPKSRNHLTDAGNDILYEYWKNYHNKSQKPPLSDRKELTNRIKAIPGCEWYTNVNTTSWFQRRIEQLRAHRDQRFPSLSEDALKHLGVLVKNQPKPSSDVLKTWADLLPDGATYQDVSAWVEYVQELVAENVSGSAASMLPTPQSTATPEPQDTENTTSAPSMKCDPACSPDVSVSSRVGTDTIPVLDSTTTPLVSASASPTSAILPPLSGNENIVQGTPEQLLKYDELAFQSIIAAFSQDPPKYPSDVDQMPTTAEGLDETWTSYDIKLNNLLHLLYPHSVC